MKFSFVNIQDHGPIDEILLSFTDLVIESTDSLFHRLLFLHKFSSPKAVLGVVFPSRNLRISLKI